jgi:adenylate cyclase
MECRDAPAESAPGGLTALETCRRLDPRVPDSASHLHHRLVALYLCREYEGALETAKHVTRLYPEYPHPYCWLAAALGQTGQIAEAREALEKAIAIAPAVFDLYVRHRVPWVRPQDHAHMLEGLWKAGWEG